MKKQVILIFSVSVLVVGLVGCKTMEAVNSDLERVFNKSPRQSDKPDEEKIVNKPVVPEQTKAKDYYPSEMVRNVQRGLNDHQYDAGPVDGLYGAQTRHAVSAYQSDRGIPVTGKLDEPTVSSMRVVFNWNGAAVSSATSTSQSSRTDDVAETTEESNKDHQEPNVPKVLKSMRVVEKTDIKKLADPFSESLGSVRVGQKLEIVEQSGSWYKVRFGSSEGFVFSEFLE